MKGQDKQGGIAFYVQHLVGIGHVKRILAIANTLAGRNIPVYMLCGGLPIPGLLVSDGVEFVQLTPVAIADGDFYRLVDEQGSELSANFRQQRIDQILNLLTRVQPRVVVTETYPFGRRQMHFEISPLLSWCRHQDTPPFVLSSIRDRIQPKRHAGRNEEILGIVRQYYDAVLIHGDSKLTPLANVYPYSDQISDKIRYTGYVTETGRQQIANTTIGKNEVIISVGGGAAGGPMLLTAMKAKKLSALGQLRWRFLIGPNLPVSIKDQLLGQRNHGLIVEELRDDFRQLLRNCRVAITQAGYNTVIDLLQANCRAVLVPYRLERESEQISRARQMAEMRRFKVVQESDLDPETLACAVDTAAEMPLPALSPINLQGTKNSADIIEEYYKLHHSR